jgi:hypothetical protein
MALEKQTVVDQIEVTASNHVQVRNCTTVTDGDSVIAQSFHRHAIAPGDDYSAEDARVQAICAATHTADVIAAYKAAQEAAQTNVAQPE